MAKPHNFTLVRMHLSSRIIEHFRYYSVLVLAAALFFQSVSVSAQENSDAQSGTDTIDVGSTPDPSSASGYLKYVAPKTIEMQIGLQVTAPAGNMLGTTALTVFPSDWPEQKVEVVGANISPVFRHSLRNLPHNNRQLVLLAQQIPAGQTVQAVLQVKIEKKHIVGPEDPTKLIVPKRLSRDLRAFLGNSPYIESNASEIKRVVKEIAASDPLTDWDRIEKYYDWVRENIAYEDGELKSVKQALKDRTGDCEEMTSVFVALCRAGRVPARVVWIPNHCYPEFYMEDEQGQGYWFPCQAAGTRNFGSMPEYLPILQKGDRFKVKEKKHSERYLADFLTAKHVTGGQPGVKFVRELLGEAAQLEAPDLGGAANPGGNP